MAKEWAKPFYNSGEWKALRHAALVRDGHTCEICGARATEVHHEIELTAQNIHDPAVSLNLSLLHSLCHDCHTAITAEQKGRSQSACGTGFYFDENGMLTPRGRAEKNGT